MKICVSSSCRFEKDWKGIVKRFPEHVVLTPDVKDLTGMSEKEVREMLGLINTEYYKQIDDCDLLYVWCPEGYIGKGVAAEIGYATAKGIWVISSDEIEDEGIDALVPEKKNLDELVCSFTLGPASV